MKKVRSFLFVLITGVIAALLAQLFIRKPVDRYIHVKSFRYGKDPSVIRVNRGDRIHLTFSTHDTGHSFFLEEFDADVKVSPARQEVEVFSTDDPTKKPVVTREYIFTAKQPGVYNFLTSKSNYRCHVWCGPMHAFEQGKLIIMPNTLLWFSLGCMLAIVILWIMSFKKALVTISLLTPVTVRDGLVSKQGVFHKMLVNRWPQGILTILALVMIYIVILTSVFGTQMSGRNLGVLLMWAIWLFLLIALLTPVFGRVWCTICPLPFFGDLLQRQSFFQPLPGKTGNYPHKYFGLFLKWPALLRNDWLRLVVFLSLATFSTTLVAKPRISGITVLMLLIVPTVMSLVWELRAFCRYLCPVSVFVGSFSRISPVALRNKSQAVCDKCKSRFCKNGSVKGWACPYGLTVPEINENTDCGLCLECTRTCPHQNVAIVKRPLASETGTRTYSEAWLTIAVFTLAFVYSVLYEGHWPVVRDYVNILDKGNWNLFVIYVLIVWSLALLFMPAVLYLLSQAGKKVAGTYVPGKSLFLSSAGILLPLGLMLWIAFVIPMLFVNVTFILQSFSDPFGWGWDFFGTANIPWHQFMPRFIPWLQSVLLLTGLFLSLRNLKRTFAAYITDSRKLFLLVMPLGIFIISVVIAMIFFFTN